MAASNRDRDMRVEREVARFLDEHLYTNPIFTKHDRTDLPEQQLSGSDIIISIPSKGIVDAIVDEKAMTTYWERPLPTFALEMDFRRFNGEIVEGWFTDVKKATEYYLAIWLKATQNDFKAEDITWLEYALVSRKKLQDYFSENFGLSPQAIREKAAFIRQNNIGKDSEKCQEKPFWFFYTYWLAEKPINMVVRKQVYLDLADIHGIIQP